MLFAIPDTLLKGALSTNKTGHHVVHYNWHAIESVLEHQQNCSPCYTV